MPEVTDEIFETALTDENNRRIISKVCRKYYGRLSKEELTSRSYIALFNCLRKHDPLRNVRFTSSLYRHVVWECHKAIRDTIRHPPPPLPKEDHLFYVESREVRYVQECLAILPDAYATIIRNYYFDRMTFREIGIVSGCTAPAAMRRLRRAEKAFRRLYGED